MNHATIKDIKRATPQLGTLVVLNGGVEVVYALRMRGICGGCVFSGWHGFTNLGTTCREVRCDANGRGAYLPKLKYLELKLLGEIT